LAGFAYTVSDGRGGHTQAWASLTLTPVNDAPTLAGETIDGQEDQALHIDAAALLANDYDVDTATLGDVLSITSVGQAEHGQVSLDEQGRISFTPEANYYGLASFSYTVSDGQGGVSTATATVNLASVNDAPQVQDELFYGKRNVAYTFQAAALLANDTDLETPQALSIVQVRNASHGQVTLLPDGSVRFSPETDYAGRGAFEYQVQDAQGGSSWGRIEIDLAAVNLVPTATDDHFVGFEDVAFQISAAQLLVNDSDADNASTSLRITAVRNASHGSVSVDDQGSVRFTPSANYFGTASFEYQVSDPDGGSTWARATLNVQSVNDAPELVDVWYGHPIFGYQLNPGFWGYDENGSSVYFPESLGQIRDHDQALGLARNNQLLNSSWETITPSYYPSGHLRPVAFDTLDEFYYDENGRITQSFDNLYLEHGYVFAYDPDGDSSALRYQLSATPQHGHASLAESGLHGTSAPVYWSFESHFGDPYTGNDPFSVVITDAQGAATTVNVAVTHHGTSAGGGGGGCCPIVLDLNNNGIELLRPEDSAMFADLNDDGWRERIGWAAPSDAVLAYDANNDGRINRAEEVSFVDYLPGAVTDLDGLAAFDTNHDGRLTQVDALWQQFGVFQDANNNGQQDMGEYCSLDQVGISAISLTRQGQAEVNNGNLMFGTTTVTYSDGHTTQAGDVMFATTDTNDARLAQLALLFNQMVNTATQPEPALGFVTTVPENATQAMTEVVLTAELLELRA
ncbi:MAG: tandem-95 repeat protein, partial [Burkholderiales bacterium]|nr:tandem-95 repeat protein [Burkholderiales bacterium]